ncbi:MAG: HAD family phosphatase [Pseudomonadota bacterium]
MNAQKNGNRPDTVIFDVGNVLIEWRPEVLIGRLADSPEQATFLERHVMNHHWFVQMDGGKTWATGVAERTRVYPEVADQIAAFNDRWMEAVPGAIEANVAVLEDLSASGCRLLGLTNFSSEKFAETRARFPFFTHFSDILVSGNENLVKPDPAIYDLLLRRNALEAGQCVFVDDSAANIEAADALGIHTVHQLPDTDLRAVLAAMGLPI